MWNASIAVVYRSHYFFLKVLGGVSEEQAAEAAAHQSDPMHEDNDDVVAEHGEGDGDNAADGTDAMEEDEELNVRKVFGLYARGVFCCVTS